MLAATDTPTAPVSKKMLWTGYVISALPALGLLFSGVMTVMKPDSVVKAFTQFGYPESMIVGIGILKTVCTIIYLIPRTAVLGAILLAGYLGGATATNVRIGDPSFIAPVVFGVLLWLGLYLREPRLRPLLPLRQ
ncbi:MAG TPA: DoxX family protein [Thermoanaerobaculia bacterium]|jgi:hypothetical protein|nr:DoxX family protein [Thermoanaerobaculia bacterium]